MQRGAGACGMPQVRGMRSSTNVDGVLPVRCFCVSASDQRPQARQGVARSEGRCPRLFPSLRRQTRLGPKCGLSGVPFSSFPRGCLLIACTLVRMRNAFSPGFFLYTVSHDIYVVVRAVCPCGLTRTLVRLSRVLTGIKGSTYPN